MIKVSRESFKMVVEDDDDPDTSWLEGEGNEAELARWRSGDLRFVGVQAFVELRIPAGPGHILHSVTTPGLWGVDSGSPEYHREVFEEECDVLADMLRAMGVSVSPDDDALGAAVRTPHPDPVLWEGTLDGQRVRVRRLDEHALLAEHLVLAPGTAWAATDDETAMRAFEAALLARLP